MVDSIPSGPSTDLRRRRRKVTGGGPMKLTPLEDSRVRPQITKKDLVEAVRRMAPAYTQDHQPVLRNRKRISVGSQQTDSYTTQIQVMEAGVNLNARKFNEIKIAADERAVTLKERLSALRALKLESDALEEMKKGENDDSLAIKALIKKIEEATADTDDKLHYRRQLDHMHRRLANNDVTFDAHLRAMEETLQATTQEENDIKLLMHQLEAGRTRAARDLEVALRKYQTEGGERHKLLHLKREQLSNARRMEKWRKHREIMQAEMASELKGTMSKEERSEYRDELMLRENSAEQIRMESEAKNRMAMVMEEAFVQIRQATGVNTLEQMVEKFKEQGTNRTGLLEERREAEDRLADAKRKKEAAEERFMELKQSGIGGTELNRDITDTLNSTILEHRAAYKVSKAATERLQTTLVALREGAAGLFQRLQGYNTLLDGPGSQASTTNAPSSGSFDMVDGQSAYSQDIRANGIAALEGLQQCEIILSKMMEALGGGEGSPGRFHMLPNEDESVSEEVTSVTDDSSSLSRTDEPLPLRNNIRVPSGMKQAEMETLQFSARSDEEPAERMLSDDLDAIIDEDMADGELDMVPSRQFLKLSSQRQTSEVLRKRDTEFRRQQIAERLAGADDNDKQMMTSNTARRKAQAEATDRLFQQPVPMGLPPGITIRDDPLTKSQAFLTQMPKLQ